MARVTFGQQPLYWAAIAFDWQYSMRVGFFPLAHIRYEAALMQPGDSSYAGQQ
jgi:hypothetical protein